MLHFPKMNFFLRLIFTRNRGLVTKIKFRYICVLLIIVFLLNSFGVFTHLFELPFEDCFTYPYEGNILTFIDALKNGEKPSINPINEYNFSFIYANEKHCLDNDYNILHVVFIIKSAIENFDRRTAIRATWGSKKRFFDVPTKIVFLLGVHMNAAVQSQIDNEVIKYEDIVQSNFIDSYYNNTIKTMLAFKWAKLYCSNSKFYMFVDDDIYVSVKNVLEFIRNPMSCIDESQNFNEFRPYKRKIKSNIISSPLNWQKFNRTKAGDNFMEKTQYIIDYELPNDMRLYAGYVFNSRPHRHKTSKWYVPLQEYPYNKWPLYVSAGAYVLSKEALVDIYFASFYIKHFRFDDIYLGIIAKKVHLKPFHCHKFHFYKKDYTTYNYKHVITSHGYSDPKELIQVWNEQKLLGNA
ncbi:beta-1,3-galactosyltransferase brn-like [Chelonus insularis]|uniref:beta-1,3-galactosyltransferase brn-like n=1 Tax=Chelonus insularis TaxID=460826 RepID=UPI00158CDB24|nr:beta-1,3-galactosyltransferase brn-like [Chelonus insularis]XP_034944782.1 beta-1,3-galactosyltransferase brn-like [Chelonus insularis]